MGTSKRYAPPYIECGGCCGRGISVCSWNGYEETCRSCKGTGNAIPAATPDVPNEREIGEQHGQ